jgi:hypothetical protein
MPEVHLPLLQWRGGGFLRCEVKNSKIEQRILETFRNWKYHKIGEYDWCTSYTRLNIEFLNQLIEYRIFKPHEGD